MLEQDDYMLVFKNSRGTALVTLVVLAVLVASVAGFAPQAMADDS